MITANFYLPLRRIIEDAMSVKACIFLSDFARRLVFLVVVEFAWEGEGVG